MKNIYACLVHENIECIIDLINNLHYQDAASTMLIYNGGTDTNLLKNNFSGSGYEAVIYPNPLIIKHGYLHPFAIDCMEYALDNFSFDCLTIVDSDQLAIRSGYSEHLDEFFLNQSNVGMLSNHVERIDQTNSANRIALQAFNEYHLWQPLLHNFSNGANCFVHWSFWPSTVFTKDACKDLVRLFKENSDLHDILNYSRIWASEEVILPTLVKLLGYEIALSPCSYEFLKYKKEFSVAEINDAFTKPDAYWIHPVERFYDSPIRKYIREHFYNYSERQEQ